MNVKNYQRKLHAKQAMVGVLRVVLKPLAYFFTVDKINARYDRKKNKITEEQAVRWIGDDIVRYLAKHQSLVWILCDWASNDDITYRITLSEFSYHHLSEKSRMAYYKFHHFHEDLPFQEKILDYVKSLPGIQCEEEIEQFTWQKIQNYQKTVHLSLA